VVNVSIHGTWQLGFSFNVLQTYYTFFIWFHLHDASVSLIVRCDLMATLQKPSSSHVIYYNTMKTFNILINYLQIKNIFNKPNCLKYVEYLHGVRSSGFSGIGGNVLTLPIVWKIPYQLLDKKKPKIINRIVVHIKFFSFFSVLFANF